MGEHTHDEIVAAVLEGCCPDCHNGDGYWSAAADDIESSYRYMPADGQYAGGRVSIKTPLDSEIKRLLPG